MIDEYEFYRGLDKNFVKHNVVNHNRKEYVRCEVHTNTADGYFGLLREV